MENQPCNTNPDPIKYLWKKKTKDFAKSCRSGTKQVFGPTCERLHINSDISHQGGQPR